MGDLFNAELGGNQWRAIKYIEGDKVNASALKKLLLAAVALDAIKGKGTGETKSPAARTLAGKEADKAPKSRAAATERPSTAATAKPLASAAPKRAGARGVTPER